MLRFNANWRFDSPGKIPDGVVADLFALIGKIASQGHRKSILEHYKSYFATAAGTTAYASSSEGWAETDLCNHMRAAAENAPLFIEAFYDACCDLQKKAPQIGVPDFNFLNRILLNRGASYRIQPPDLISDVPEPVVVDSAIPSLDEQAQEIIQRALNSSATFLSNGQHRQAVQEILWLLETVSTAFRGIGTETGSVQGNYFNKIVKDLRKSSRGKTLDQVLAWLTMLHGYLSSPTGGGVRHGTDLAKGIDMEPHEAQLFCNLIRSYIGYLVGEYERLARANNSSRSG